MSTLSKVCLALANQHLASFPTDLIACLVLATGFFGCLVQCHVKFSMIVYIVFGTVAQLLSLCDCPMTLMYDQDEVRWINKWLRSKKS